MELSILKLYICDFFTAAKFVFAAVNQTIFASPTDARKGHRRHVSRTDSYTDYRAFIWPGHWQLLKRMHLSYTVGEDHRARAFTLHELWVSASLV